jgi:hypothetical protein
MAQTSIHLLDSGKNLSISGDPAVTIDSTGADLIVAFGAIRSASTINGISDTQSNTYTLLETQSNSGGSLRLWAVKNPTNSATLTVTFDVATGNDRFLIVAAFDGTTFTTNHYDDASASSSSLAFTADSIEDWIVAGGFEQGTTGIGGYGSGQTEIEAQTSFGGYELAVTYEQPTTIASNTQSFTNADKIAGLILDSRDRYFTTQ